MTIRAKLNALIIGMVVAFATSVMLYLAILSPVSKMEAEQGVLTLLRNSMIDRSLKANLVLTSPDFSAAVAESVLSRERMMSDFAAVGDLKFLPKASEKIKSALESIDTLNGLVEEYDTAVDFSIKAIETHRPQDSADAPFNLFTSVLSGSPTDSTMASLTGDAIPFAINISNLTKSLITAIEVIDKQYAEISTETSKIKARSLNIVALAVILVFAFTILLATRMTSSLARSIRTIVSRIDEMKDGDLVGMVNVASSDEIGALSKDLTSFSGNLRASISNIQTASAENIASKGRLISAAKETVASAERIADGGDSVALRIAQLDDSLGSATESVESIDTGINGLNERIQDQMTMVEESTASVTEMIASIGNVSKITDQRQVVMDRLSETVSAGGVKINATYEEVHSISESVDSIRNITGIIESISSQTNLLAMNAAIEAAHAGSAGKGFSVVADEIRKLAEASAVNSNEISSILKSIIARIDSATRSGAETNAAFQAIDKGFVELRESFTEIASNMSEMRAGGGQILQAMNSLRDASTEVKEVSSSISKSSLAIRQTMVTLKSVSAEVAAGMSGISGGTKAISSAMKEVLSNAEQIGTIGELLNTDLARFRTA